MTDTTVQNIRVKLSVAVTAETAASEAVAALEAAARQGETVHPSELAEAMGRLSLRRLRREQVEVEVEVAAAEAAAAERAEAVQALAARAASDPQLNPARLLDLEAAARKAVQEYAAAVRAQDRAFGRLVNDARERGLPLLPPADRTTNSGLIASTVYQQGRRETFGDPNRVRLAGHDFTAPAPGRLDSFLRWVRSVVN